MFLCSVATLAFLALGLVAAVQPEAETHQYQAQVSKLMKMIINSMYSNRDVFLRELLSNASDALDKVRMKSLEDRSVLDMNPLLRIRVYTDRLDNKLIVEDTGIGMGRAELIDDLGTIAKSGTEELLKKLQQDGKRATSDDNLIGQFGVGFYASFLVADRVEVISKGVGDGKQWIWRSEADAQEFSVKEDPEGDTLKRGTRVILHLKKDAREYLEKEKLEELIKKFSQFFTHPIYLVAQVEEEPAKKTNDGQEKEEEKDSTKKPEKILVEKEILMNPDKPIWLREPKEVTREEYNAFYKAYFNDYKDPLDWVHFKGEGDVNFRALIFIPTRPPFSPFSARSEREEQSKTVSLFVRRVFTQRVQLFSEALSFPVGIIDSDDLTLNMSRELLQNSELLEQIKRKVTNKVLDMLSQLAENDPKAFEAFFSAFAPNIKLEIIQSDAFRKRLSKLLRYATTKSDKPKSLSEYVEGMAEDQKYVYFLTGQDLAELKKSPFVEGFLADNTEVILATEPLDEYCLQALAKFEDREFRNSAKEKAVKKKVEEAEASQFRELCEWLKKDVLEPLVSDVRVSNRFTKSSCAVAVPESGFSGHMESVLRAQAGAASDPMLKYIEMQKRVFELNPKHPVILALRDVHQAGRLEEASEISRTIYDAALIRSGFSLKNSKQFMDGIDRLILKSLNSAGNGSQPSKSSVAVEENVKKESEATSSEPKAGTNNDRDEL